MRVYRVRHGDLQHPVFGASDRPLSRWEAWCWLLEQAADAAIEVQVNRRVVSLERGQIPASLGRLTNAWRWQKLAVQRFLRGLEKAGFISLKIPSRATPATDAPVTVITIINFDG